MSPKTLFKILMFALCYLTASLAWAFIAVPELIGSSSDALVIAGFFGTGIWLICTACIVLYVLNTRKPAGNSEHEK